jgi:hypothetical protein
MDVPLEILDGEVARAAACIRAARAALGRGEAPDDDNPLSAYRRVSSRATYLELLPPAPDAAARDAAPPAKGAAPPVSPGSALRDALREWVYALTLDRVLWADTLRIEAALRDESIQVEHADLGRLSASPRSLLERMLAEPASARLRLWAEAFGRGAGAAADAARIFEERRAEAVRRLSAEPDSIEIPCDPKGALAGLAEALLRRTEPLLERTPGAYYDVIASSIGRSLGDGWPARLVPRWLDELFRGTGLTEGLRLDLGPLPKAFGASSFARALAAFGAALADADGPRGAPFALAYAPFDLRRARRAALFGSLPADPIFGVRALSLGHGRARDQARAIARALLTSLRLLAARVLLRGVLTLPEHARAQRFEERTAEALGAPIPPALAGVVPRLGPSDPTALMGALLAIRDRRELIERFDEDWFRNPYAARAIREEDGVVAPSRRAPAARLEAGLDELLAVLGSY